ncbi:response regulator [Thermodesulfobacteriota bacterium]
MKSRHILLVNDDEQKRFNQTLLLSRHGYRVKVAENSTQAIYKIIENISAEEPFDLIVLGNNIDNIHGINLVDILRTGGMTVPVLVVGDAASSTEYGTIEHLGGSGLGDSLLIAVEKHLNPHGCYWPHPQAYSMEAMVQ